MKSGILHKAVPVAVWLALSPVNPAWADGQAPAFGDFLNGGVGQESRQEMESQRNLYNLRLVFAMAGSGEFVSGVSLTLQRQGESGAGEHYDNCGPLFYVRLRPGIWHLRAGYEGKGQVASIRVGAQPRTHYIYWH